MGFDNNLTAKSERDFYLLVMALNCGAFFIGTQYGVLTMAQPTINAIFEVESPVVISVMNSSLMFGGVFGSMMAERILKIISRRTSLILTDLVAIFAVLLSQIIDIRIFVTYRLIAGAAFGLNCSLIPQIVKEYSPSHLTGVLGSYFALFIPLGLAFSYLIGLGYPQEVDPTSSYWRFAFLIPLLPLLGRVYLLLKTYVIEPPIYYVEFGQEERAFEFYDKYYQNVSRQDFDTIVLELRELIRLDKKSKEQSYIQLFDSPSMTRRVIVGCAIQLIQVFTGMISIIFFSNYIFMKSTNSFMLSFILSMIFVLLLCVTCIISGLLLKRVGIKRLLEVGTFFILIFLLALGVSSLMLESASPESEGFYQLVIIISIFAFTIAFGVSIGPLTWVYNAEILPTKGIALATFTNITSNVFISFIFPILNSALGIGPVFLIFSFNTFLGFLFIKNYMLDIQGKTKQEIEIMYSRPSDPVQTDS